MLTEQCQMLVNGSHTRVSIYRLKKKRQIGHFYETHMDSEMSSASRTHDELIIKLQGEVCPGGVPALYHSVSCSCGLGICFLDYVHNTVCRVSLHLRTSMGLSLANRGRPVPSPSPSPSPPSAQKLFGARHLSRVSCLSLPRPLGNAVMSKFNPGSITPSSP